MREIKVRGQDFDTGEWIYGSYNGVNAGVADVFIIYEKEILDPVSFGFIDTEIVEKEVKEETVGQYTGIKDKKGVEIYEGDLLDIKSAGGDRGYVPVVFRDASFMMHIPYWVNDYYHLSDYDSDLYEVIGNIYEHHHLLESNQ